MSARWALPTMKQTVWVIPRTGLDSSIKNRADPLYDMSACYPIKCRMVQDTSRIIVVDGNDCRVSAEISTYEKVPKTARLFLTEDDKNSLNLNRSKAIGMVRESPDMIPTNAPLFKVMTI